MTNPIPHGQVPESLRLAEEISNLVCSSEAAAKTIAAAADELCRLHVENASLRAQQPASPPAEQAAPKAAPGELSADSLRHQNKLLAETLGACILASGIVRKDIDGFTGPELLHFGEDLRSMLEVAPKQEVQEPTQEMVDAVMSLVDLEVSDPEGHRYDDGSKLAAQICRAVLALAPQQEAQEPYAYAVYFPDQPTVELVHELDDLIDDLTNRPHVVTKLYTAPQPSPAAQGDAIEHELAMLILRIVSSARRNCEDGSNVLKLANEAWAYLVRKGLNGSPLRDAGIESDPTPPAKAADSVLEDAARWQWLAGYLIGERTDLDEGIVACATIDALRQFADAARKQGGAT